MCCKSIKSLLQEKTNFMLAPSLKPLRGFLVASGSNWDPPPLWDLPPGHDSGYKSSLADP